MRSGLYKLARWKQHSMKTCEVLKALLTQQLLELEQPAANWPSTIEERHVKEQEIGRQWYEAEQDLSQLALTTLKKGPWHQ
jgi:cytochrome c-type biogenesis protein CcmH/NrfG